MAIVYDVVGSSLSGLEHLEAARVHYSELADEAGLIRCQMVRAALYVRTSDHDHAVSCYLECADYYRGAERRDDLASVLSNLTYVYRMMGRHDEAVAAGEEAVSLASSLLIRASALANLAFSLAVAGRMDAAEERVQQAEPLLEELGDPNYLTVHRRALAWVRLHQGRYAEAEELLQYVISEAAAKGYLREQIEAHALLADVYRAQESWRERSEEHTSELQSRGHLVCRLLLEKK